MVTGNVSALLRHRTKSPAARGQTYLKVKRSFLNCNAVPIYFILFFYLESSTDLKLIKVDDYLIPCIA